jgi:hypothetical protein
MTTHTAQSGTVSPFTVTIPEADLVDLQNRLAHTRLPQPAPGDGWEYGTPVS